MFVDYLIISWLKRWQTMIYSSLQCLVMIDHGFCNRRGEVTASIMGASWSQAGYPTWVLPFLDPHVSRPTIIDERGCVDGIKILTKEKQQNHVFYHLLKVCDLDFKKTRKEWTGRNMYLYTVNVQTCVCN